MAKRVSLAISLTLLAGFLVGAGCSSIPDHRKVLSGSGQDAGDGGDNGVDGGETGGIGAGGKGGTAGTGNGGLGGSGATSAGGRGAGGRGAGNTDGGVAAGGTRVVFIDGGPEGGIVGIPCGTTACTDRAVGRTTYPACCAGPKQDRCGLDTTVAGGMGCVEPDQAGVSDTVCKDVTSPDDSTIILYYACCRPDGKCGLFYDIVGGPNFGCVDPTEIGQAAGKDCTPASCTAAGAACTKNSECCPGSAGSPVCAQLAGNGTGTCTDHCVTNRDCLTGCCVTLIDGRGACAPAASCSATCRKLDETCDVDADCCSGNVCAPTVANGPRLCRPRCSSNAVCTPEFCVKDEAGRGTCSSPGTGLCSDTCYNANDGSCEDGGRDSIYGDCALGTDCSDCGGTAKFGRTGGTSKCFDSCSTHGNGKCEDGGTHASASTCLFGTDCTDCGPRLGICENDCPEANDGYCDDGGPGSVTDDCAPGTDCADCGVLRGGRGQGVCDGTTGYQCFPREGIRLGDEDDSICQCPDCPWDAADCKVTASLCDGKALGACCAPNNPCKIQFDGVCACGGWCPWETPDCGRATRIPFCDGFEVSDACSYPMPASSASLRGNGKCDCGGGCSWEQADCASLGELCADTCAKANNGNCDDDGVCAYGTDCADCGPRYPH